MDEEMNSETLEIFICRRTRTSPRTCCGNNLSEEEFTLIKKLEDEYSVNITPRGCMALCPYQGFAIQRDIRPEIVSSIDDLREKIEAYKKERVSEGSNGYSDR